MNHGAIAIALLLTSCATQSVDSIYAAQSTCDGLGDTCIGGGRCCRGMSCGFDVACCVSAHELCDQDSDCCSGACVNRRCEPSPPGEACNASSECDAGLECSPTLDLCYATTGGYCRTSNDCGSNLCDDGVCACGQGSSLCTSGEDCCDGFVCDGGLCRGNGGATCGADTDCNAGCCVDGECQSCGD